MEAFPRGTAAALALAVCTIARVAPGADQYRPFESATAGLRITLPEGWDVTPGPGAVVATARSGPRSMTVAVEAREERAGAANLSEEDAERLWKSSLGEIPLAAPEARPSGQGEATLGGAPARFAWARLPGSAGREGAALMVYTVMAARKGTLVRITLVAPQPEYRAARQAFDASLGSLAWLR